MRHRHPGSEVPAKSGRKFAKQEQDPKRKPGVKSGKRNNRPQGPIAPYSVRARPRQRTAVLTALLVVVAGLQSAGAAAEYPFLSSDRVRVRRGSPCPLDRVDSRRQYADQRNQRLAVQKRRPYRPQHLRATNEASCPATTSSQRPDCAGKRESGRKDPRLDRPWGLLLQS